MSNGEEELVESNPQIILGVGILDVCGWNTKQVDVIQGSHLFRNTIPPSSEQKVVVCVSFVFRSLYVYRIKRNELKLWK